MTPFAFHETPAPQPGERSIVVPTGLKSKQELFDFLRRAVPLPDYFGDNWDALEECLVDLAYSCDSNIALIHADIPLADLRDDQRIYLQILADVKEDSHGLRVIFPERCRHEIERLLSDRE